MNWTPFLSLAGLFIGFRVLGKPSGWVRAHFTNTLSITLFHRAFFICLYLIAVSHLGNLNRFSNKWKYDATVVAFFLYVNNMSSYLQSTPCIHPVIVFLSSTTRLFVCTVHTIICIRCFCSGVGFFFKREYLNV